MPAATYASSSRPTTPGACPSTCSCSATLASTAGSPAITAGKSITSATPSIAPAAQQPGELARAERLRGDSSALAGTHEEAIT